jgi:pimeloyl-ACP methyl ester carboxylesterase
VATSPDLPMSIARDGNVPVHYEVAGEGPPLLLHTGAGGDGRIWQEAGYPMGLAGFRVIAGQGHLGSFYRSDLALPIALPFLREHLRRDR